MKKDLHNIKTWEYVTFALFIILIGFTQISAVFTFFLTIYAFAFTMFSYDIRFNIRAFVHALPVSINTIVLSRILSILCLSIIIFLVQYVQMSLLNAMSYNVAYAYTLLDFFMLGLLVSIGLVFALPVYYLTKSTYVSNVILAVMIFGFIGVANFMEDVKTHTGTSEVSLNVLELSKRLLATSPFLMITICTITLLIITYFSSVWIMNKKDIV